MLMVLLPLPITRKMVVNSVVWVSTLGLPPARLPGLVHSYVHTYLLKRFVSSLHRGGLDQVSVHRNAGHEVVVATGALELLARAICDAEGLQDVVVVGSSLRRRLGGLVADQHCVGNRKVSMLTVRGYPPDWDFVYTDHHADLPILSRGRRRFLVNPTPYTIGRVSKVLSPMPTVLHWE
jgi:phosphatidylglycerophosphatase C